jgi:cytochrome c peroxidase
MRAARPRTGVCVGLVACLGLAGCAGDSPLEPDNRPGANFPPLYVPEDNPSTPEGVALGRQLYYDVRMSPEGNRACATCHLQEHSFSNPHVRDGLAHINLAWSTNFLWDGRFEGTLEEAMLMEVEEFFETDLDMLREPDLERMFDAAFGTPEVTAQRAAYALAQFQRTMVSDSSRFDRYLEGEESALTDSEVRGMNLFYSEQGECFHCHATRLLTDNRFHNIGLDAEVAGTGRGAVTGRAREDGQWKTPTLRNVEHTAPYMHDGRFETLEEVVAFYSDGVILTDTLDTLITVGGFRLAAHEQADLVAFLRSLSDEEFLTDPALANPN